ncbi:hypothetical protein ZHAS_00014183 [Anopheles sinensis]|uniref:Uncharacterized protein n=1 Tax=Anopheles sinensis TaxID=74873 RepID=A0A084W7I7_ANOSI|nr:hypothetical protein ZHAS_00014183 [Anopheles sinensis]
MVSDGGSITYPHQTNEGSTGTSDPCEWRNHPYILQGPPSKRSLRRSVPGH